MDNASVEWQSVVLTLLRHLTLYAVEQFMLDKEHWVVVANRGLQHTLGVRGSCRHDDLEAGDMGIHRLEHLRVLCATLCAAPSWHANDDGHDRLAAKHIAKLG